ncbi:MAG: hypothetical protein WCW66_02780 [Patescibacteria group bacterium]
MTEEYPSSGEGQNQSKNTKIWIIFLAVVALAILAFIWWWINDGGEIGFSMNKTLSYYIS